MKKTPNAERPTPNVQSKKEMIVIFSFYFRAASNPFRVTL